MSGPPAHVRTPLEWTSPAAVLWGTPTSSLKGSPSLHACPTSQTNTRGRPWRWSTCWENTGSSVTWCWWWVPRRSTRTVWSSLPAAPISGMRRHCVIPHQASLFTAKFLDSSDCCDTKNNVIFLFPVLLQGHVYWRAGREQADGSGYSWHWWESHGAADWLCLYITGKDGSMLLELTAGAH